MRRGSAVHIVNDTARDHILASAELGVLTRLRRGQSLVITPSNTGPAQIRVSAAPEADPAAGTADAQAQPQTDRASRPHGEPAVATATLYVAEGAFSEVQGNGRWVIENVDPCHGRLGVWSPMFPGETRGIELGPDEVRRVDLGMGVPYLPSGHAEVAP
jgi:hypothetical protein